MSERGRSTLAWALLVLTGAGLGALAALDALLRGAGRADLVTGFHLAGSGFIVSVVASGVIGALLAVRLPRHPVGWLLLSLALAIDGSGIFGDWANYALLARPGRPGGALAAVLDRNSFITWFALLGLILLLTPDGHPPGPRWRWVARVIVGGTVVAVALRLVRPGEIGHTGFAFPPNPLGQAWAGGVVARAVRSLSLLAVNVGLLGGVVSLFVRFRRARGVVRQQLLWVAFGAGVMTVCILNQIWILALLAGNPAAKAALLAINSGVLLPALPVTVGIAILQYRLYDLGRLVSRSVSYLLLTGVLAGAYAVAALLLGQIVGRQSSLAVAGATLVAASLVGIGRRRVQDEVDRRFNRRRWVALRVVEDFTRRADGAASGGPGIEAVLASALGDPSLEVAYLLHSGHDWVASNGEHLDEPVPTENRLVTLVRRRGAVVAALGHCAEVAGGPSVVRAVADAAATELDNARLRAEVHLQVVDVQQSRARIVAAGDAERQRIERNLHDGAQQRLVALGLQLRTSRRRVESGGDVGEAVAALDRASDELGRAVEDLRELANGLHPAVLYDEGLAAALESLADRSPIPVCVDAPAERVAPEVEAAAFYVACEGLSNAIKHARATKVDISAHLGAKTLVLNVIDDGVGGATRAGGTGLQGLVDRVEAAGGRLSLLSAPHQGTTLTVELPCGS